MTIVVLPVSESQIRMVLSLDADAISFPSGLKQAQFAQYVCPSKILISLPFFTSHIRIVLSLEADTIRFPSELKQAKLTEDV